MPAAPPPVRPVTLACRALVLGSAMVGGLLGGCAIVPLSSVPAPVASRAEAGRAAVTPVAASDPAATATAPAKRTVSMANEMGRSALREQRFEEALVWFRRATEANPRLAEAYNGAAIALAALGRHPEAEAWLLRAAAAGLDSPDIRANLGWLQTAMAQGAMNTHAAAVPTPTPSQTPANEAEPTARSQEPTGPAGPAAPAPPPAMAMLRPAEPREATERAGLQGQAETVGGSDPPARAGTAGPEAPGRAPGVGEETLAGSDDPATRLSATAAASVTLPMPVAAEPEPALAAAPPAQSRALESPTVRVRLEVSNGTGITGLARRTAQALRDSAQHVGPARLSNHSHFGVVQTQLQVRQDLGAAARTALERELASTLGQAVQVVAVSGLAAGVDARLVLGRDLTRADAPSAGQPRPAPTTAARAERAGAG